MPNHVANFVNITGKDRAELMVLMETEDNPFDFNRIFPCPEILLNRTAPFRREGEETEEEAEALRKKLVRKYAADSWYTWCVDNWGTKWNSYEHFESDRYDYEFYTAWGPPDPVYCALTKRFDVEIHVVDHDEGGSFCTKMIYRDGACISYFDLDERAAEKIELMRHF